MQSRICQFALLLALLLYGSGAVGFVHLAIEHAPGGSHYHGCQGSCQHSRHADHDDTESSDDDTSHGNDLQYCDFLLSLHLLGGEVAIAPPMLAEEPPVGYVRDWSAPAIVVRAVSIPFARGPPIA